MRFAFKEVTDNTGVGKNFNFRLNFLRKLKWLTFKVGDYILQLLQLLKLKPSRTVCEGFIQGMKPLADEKV